METRGGRSRVLAMSLVLGVVGCGEVERGGSGASNAAQSQEAAGGGREPLPKLVRNRFGASRTMTANGTPLNDPENPFFHSLGQNGRSCSSCHVPEGGMTITPELVQARFARTDGLDPLFRTVDGATSPLADVSSVAARRSAFGLLLDRGLIRVGIGIPSNAEFELVGVDDPYGFASAKELSLFRRPLPSTNLRFLSTVMWDGRETFKDACVRPNGFASLHFDLAHQANRRNDRARQAARALTPAQQRGHRRLRARPLHRAGLRQGRRAASRRGGAAAGPGPLVEPGVLLRHQRHAGRRLRTGRALHVRRVHALRRVESTSDAGDRQGEARRARRAIARGQALFNPSRSRSTGRRASTTTSRCPSIPGTCTTCHDAPNAATTRCRRRSTSASADACAAHRRTCRSTRCATGRPASGPDDRPRPRADHRPVEGHRPLQGADPARARGARAVLPQRLGGAAWRTVVELLRRPLQHRPDDAEKADLVAFLAAL